MRLAENRAKELQDELTDTYKEKSRLAEQLVAASQQLQIVRESNEAQVSYTVIWELSSCLRGKEC